MADCWLVRSSGGELFDIFREKSIVALGWHEIGDLRRFNDRDAIAARMKEIWPDLSQQSINVSANQVFRFWQMVKINDDIVTYDPSRRIYLLGKVLGDYDYNEHIIGDEYPNIRRVSWNPNSIGRDFLKQSSRNSLGSTLAIFKVAPEIRDELLSVLSGGGVDTSDSADSLREQVDAQPTPEDDGVELVMDVPAKAVELIKDRISNLTPYQAQDLVAGLLRAMGYRTRVSPPGPDMGKDIVASRDGLGFERPRIFFQVKHKLGTTDVREIGEFMGRVLRSDDDRGLFVSKGGFTKDARMEAERSQRPIQLMDLDLLVDFVLQHYEKFDTEAQQLLPLKRVLWPSWD